jgi:mevalonate kinase
LGLLRTFYTTIENDEDFLTEEKEAITIKITSIVEERNKLFEQFQTLYEKLNQDVECLRKKLMNRSTKLNCEVIDHPLSIELLEIFGKNQKEIQKNIDMIGVSIRE